MARKHYLVVDPLLVLLFPLVLLFVFYRKLLLLLEVAGLDEDHLILILFLLILSTAIIIAGIIAIPLRSFALSIISFFFSIIVLICYEQ